MSRGRRAIDRVTYDTQLWVRFLSLMGEDGTYERQAEFLGMSLGVLKKISSLGAVPGSYIERFKAAIKRLEEST